MRHIPTYQEMTRLTAPMPRVKWILRVIRHHAATGKQTDREIGQDTRKQTNHQATRIKKIVTRQEELVGA